MKLTPDGWAQAYDAGRRLRSLLRDDDTLHFFTSPYRRTRETTEGILSTLTANDQEPSPFKRSNIKVYEEPRLREQDFGNFQPCSAEMERMWQERADYGHFFYRIPNGESAADAYDRVSGFNESLWRQFSEDDFASVCVLVTHGLMSRVFLMKWYHFSVEYFEDLRNVNHCEFLIMNREDTGKYTLQNKLRTWSELRKEKEAKEAAERAKSKDIVAPTNGRDRQLSVAAPPRRWGGCPEGCDHGKHFKIRRDLAELRSVDEKHAAKNCITITNGATYINSTGSIATRRAPPRPALSSDDDSDDPRALGGPQIDVIRAREEVVSSPDGTPSFITIEDRMRNQLNSPRFLHVGRDFGGTRSGANSDTDVSEDDALQRVAGAARVKHANGTNGTNGTSNGSTNGKVATNGTNGANGVNGVKDGKYSANGGMGWGAHANKLGDAPAGCCSDNASEDGGDEREDDDLARAEREDKSIKGSVY